MEISYSKKSYQNPIISFPNVSLVTFLEIQILRHHIRGDVEAKKNLRFLDPNATLKWSDKG